MSPPFDFSSLLRHSGFLRGLALALVDGDSHRADDLVQDTWVRASSASAAGVRPRRPRAWLATIARNASRMRSRSGARRRRREEANARGEQVASAADSAARLEIQQRVVAAVCALAEPHRTTVLRRYYDDLPVTEIARRDGVTPRAIQKRLQAALSQMRATLDKACGGRPAWTVPLAPLAPLVSPAALWLGGRALAALLVVGTLTVGGIAWAARAGPESHRTQPTARETATRAVPEATPHVPASPSVSAGPVVLVLASDGLPVASARVEHDGAVVTTGTKGRAVFARWSADTVTVRAEGYLTARQQTDGDVSMVRVVLERGLSLPGLVCDAQTGAPLSGVRLRLADDTNTGPLEADLLTDGAGRFVTAVRRGVPFRLKVRPRGYSPRVVFGVRFEAGEPLRIEMGKGAVLRGIVRTPEGRPVAGARVLVARPAADWVREFSRFERTFWDGEVAPEPVRTDEHGVFLWHGLARGPYEVVARSGSALGARRSIDLGDAAATVALTLESLPLLRLRVVDAQGRSIAACRLHIVRENVAGAFHGRTDAAGTLSAAVPAPGRYRIGLHPHAHASAVRHVEVGPKTTDHTLVLPDGLVLRGRVVTADGAAASGVFVRGGSRSCRTGSDGSFALLGLADKPIDVTVGGGVGRFLEARIAKAQPGGPAVTVTVNKMPVLRGSCTGRRLRAHLVRPGGSVWERSVEVAADGSFALGVPAGLIRVELRLPGRAPVIVTDLAMAAGAVRELGHLDPPPGDVLSGLVQDETGAPVAGAKVGLLVTEGRRLRSAGTAFSGPAGRFSLSGVSAGPGRLFASGRFGQSRLVDVARGQGRTGVVLTLPRAGRLVAYLPGLAPGDPVRVVRVADSKETTLSEGAPGAWSADLPPGRYRLRAGSQDIAVVQLQPGESLEIAHRLR